MITLQALKFCGYRYGQTNTHIQTHTPIAKHLPPITEPRQNSTTVSVSAQSCNSRKKMFCTIMHRFTTTNLPPQTLFALDLNSKIF